MTRPIWQLSAVRTARAIRKREVSALEITRAHIERMHKVNSAVNAVVVDMSDEAIKAAKAADRSLAKGAEIGPLHGVPITIKENIDVKGRPNPMYKIIDKATWTARYKRIREFELGLIDNGTTILKFFLHISKEEQLARFEQRLDDPARNWKISESDYSERELWDDYIAAFEDAIGATSTRDAPWYVIPSNHKWFRNLAVSQIMADTMEELRMAFPKPSVDLTDIRRKYHAAVEEEHKHKRGG